MSSRSVHEYSRLGSGSNVAHGADKLEQLPGGEILSRIWIMSMPSRTARAAQARISA
jgi:hypothetical protein